MDREPSVDVGSPRRRVGTAPTEGRAGHCQSRDDEDRADDEVRPLAGGPDQERSGEHVPDQAGTRDFTFCSELALQVEQLIAVPIANPSRIEPEQHAYQTRVHTGWTPIRARPTRVILSSRLSWSVSAAVPAAVIS